VIDKTTWHGVSGGTDPMTREEHQLVLTLFARQEWFIKQLVETLKNKVNLSPREYSAWQQSLASAEPWDDPVFYSQINDIYQHLATGLGLKTNS
jgi:hypothetical protein